MTRCNLFSFGTLLVIVSLSACGYYRIVSESINMGKLAVQPPVQMNTPAKAHLKDGGVVLFPEGFRVDGDVLRGNGEKFDITRRSRTLVEPVSLSDVAALENYSEELKLAKSAVVSIPGAFIYPVGVVLILVAFTGGF